MTVRKAILTISAAALLLGCGPNDSPEARAKTGKRLLFYRSGFQIPLEQYLAPPYGMGLNADATPLTAEQMHLVGKVKSVTQTFRAAMGGSTNITTTQTNFFPDGRIKDATSKSEDGRVFRLVKYGYNPEGKIAGITEDDPIINKRLSVMFTYSTDSTLSRIAEFKGDVEDRQLEITSQKGHPTELLGKVANVEQWRVTYQHELDGSVTITRYSKEDGEPEKESGNFHFDSVGRPSRMDYLQPDSVDPDQPYRKGQYKFEYLPNLLRHIHIAMDFPKINDKCDLDVTLFPNGDEASGQVNSKRFAFANRLGVPGCMVEITEKNISRDAMGNIVRDTQGIHQTEDLGRTVTSADFDISYVYTYY